VLPIRCRPRRPADANGGRYQRAAKGFLVPVGEILIDSALAAERTLTGQPMLNVERLLAAERTLTAERPLAAEGRVRAPVSGALAGRPSSQLTGRAARSTRRLVLLPLLGAAAVLTRIEELPAALLVPTLIALLAAVDFLLGLVAKSWSGSGSAPLLTLGLALSAVLFWLYGISLRHGHLSSITLGWVVVLTVADLLVDRFQFGVQLPPSKWLAAAGAVVLLGYLIWPTRH
jgi:hypothetical protein